MIFIMQKWKYKIYRWNLRSLKLFLFAMRFWAKNSLLSNDVLVNLHVEIESQMDYKPGYPIEKRGLYYLSREL